MIFVLIFFNIIFAVLFYLVWTWYFSFIPIIFSVFLITNLWSIFQDIWEKKIDYKKLLIKNVFFLSYALIILGIYWVFQQTQILNINDIQFLIILVGTNILLTSISYVIQYNDWKSIFHFGYYFCFGIIFYELIKHSPQIDYIFNLTLLFIVLTFAFYSFIVFVVWAIIKDKLNSIKQLNFLFFIFFVVVLIYSKMYSVPYLSVLISQLFLTFTFWFIYYINTYSRWIQWSYRTEADLIDKILSGKNILQKKENFKDEMFLKLNDFFVSIPTHIKFFLALLNIFLIFAQIYLFVLNIWGTDILYYEIIYWMAILIFFINFILVKRINYYYYLQRIFAFFILNFWIYLTIINIFWESYTYMAIFGIWWSLLSSLILFFTKFLMYKKFFFKEDYYFWILANFITIFVNAYFIYYIDIQFALKTSLILLYVGIWIFITFYNIKYIQKEIH